jgi:hypothetical protein
VGDHHTASAEETMITCGNHQTASAEETVARGNRIASVETTVAEGDPHPADNAVKDGVKDKEREDARGRIQDMVEIKNVV